MPHNVGRYQQGSIKTMDAKGSKCAGDKTPVKAPPAGAVPHNQVPTRLNGNTVGNNDSHTAH